MKQSVVILAAGIGSRYGGLKQIDPVGPSGELIIDYSVFDAVRAGFEHIVFVIRRNIEEAFHASIGRRAEPHVEIDYAFQEIDDLPSGFTVPAQRRKPWGTGQAVLAARKRVDGPYVVINADDFYGRNAYVVMRRFLQDTAADPTAYAMVGYTLRQTLSEHGSVARGICRADEAGRLVQLDELTAIEQHGPDVRCGQRELTGNELASMNFWGFKPSFFEHLAERFPRFLREHGSDPKCEFFMPVVVDELVRGGRTTVQVLETDSRWLGMTNPEDKADVAHAIRGMIDIGEYPETLWQGV